MGVLIILSFGVLYVFIDTTPSRAGPPCANTHLLFGRACVASTIRIVKFAQKYPRIEGVVDVTWEFYSLNLIRYVAPLILAHHVSYLSRQCADQLNDHKNPTNEENLKR